MQDQREYQKRYAAEHKDERRAYMRDYMKGYRRGGRRFVRTSELAAILTSGRATKEILAAVEKLVPPDLLED